MRVQIRDREALARLSLVDVRAYLTSRDWGVKGPYGSLGTIYSMTVVDGREIELLLPNREDLGDYAARMGDVVEVLSEVEGRDQLSVYADLELIRGKGNVFREFGHADADAEHLKAVLAARIVKVLDKRTMSVRAAGDLTGIAAADFSRIRRAKLDRFTIDRLMIILGRLDQKVDIAFSVRPRAAQRAPAQR